MKPEYVDHKELCKRALFACDSSDDYGYTPSPSLLSTQTRKVSYILLCVTSQSVWVYEGQNVNKTGALFGVF